MNGQFYFLRLVTVIMATFWVNVFGGINKEAINFYNRASEIEGWDPQSLILKEQLYKKAIELDPDFAEAHNNLGDVYERQERYQKAIEEYSTAARLKPDSAVPCLSLGDVYFRIGDLEKSAEWYKKGLQLSFGDELAEKRIRAMAGIKRNKVIKAETIKTLLMPTTRGRAQTISLTFGEGLIPFDFDKYDIREDAKAQLNEIGKALNGMIAGKKDITVEMAGYPVYEIAGHTDERGSDEYNMKLSEKRARAVAEYLVKNFNIPAERLDPKGYGERVPIFPKATTEGQHALNRRVEIVVKYQEAGGSEKERTRKITQRDSNSRKLTMEIGFFYKMAEERTVKVIRDEETRLRSHLDNYFIFFRPQQNCYVYILQEDSADSVDLIFPEKGGKGTVEKDKDYWLPAFGKGFTLDDVKGKETIYFLVTSWPLETEIEGLTLKEQVRGAISALKTRRIAVIKPSEFNSCATFEQLQEPATLSSFIEKVEGSGGWVKVVNFFHD